MRHIARTLTAILLAAVAIPASAQENPASEPLRVLIDWFVNPDHAPLVIAEQEGFFERRGLDVEIVPPADPSTPPRLVAAGQAEIAVTYQPALMMQVDQGLPLTRFGTLVDTPLNSLVALEGNGIASLEDFEGKTVGYSVGGTEDTLLAVMLETVGLSLDDVTTVAVNFALSQSLMSGRVDAVVGAFRNFELNQIEIEGETGVAFYPEENGVPIYDELIYATRRDMADDPRLPAFLAAVQEATIHLINHPEESWRTFIAAHPDLDDELNARAWRDTLPRFAKNPALLDEARYEAFAAFMIERGMIEDAPDLADYAVELTPE